MYEYIILYQPPKYSFEKDDYHIGCSKKEKNKRYFDIQKETKMTILAVSNNFSLLERLCNGLSSILPDADIIRETDSLMAGKYSFNHHIDMMFADVNMKMK